MDVSQAVDALKEAFAYDTDLAWTWHCNIAIQFIDRGGSPDIANQAAANFMSIAFGARGYEPKGTEPAPAEPPKERMLKWFEYKHLPEHLAVVSMKFYELACSICSLVEPGPERTVALRKLLEAKDAAVRAKLNPGG